ncbi:MAG TPA: DUF899 domain-containing protein [Baekduia sp.]|jgi:predicted dithiol-disulfide oxidoreductase (DUF899 family)
MSLPQIVSHEEWLVARKALLAQEKAATKARDALSTQRRELPMVEITKDYKFKGPEGELSLAELFAGRRQLMVSHFMFDPSWTDGCSSCTAGADEMSDGLREHLATRDTRLVYVSRAPLAKLEDYKSRKGWTFPWYSSFGSDFNYDFHVTVDERVTPLEYNYKSREEHERDGTAYYFDAEQPIEQPGLSVFLRDGDRVFHTYSTFGRGAEWNGGSYALLDLTPLGRQEAWEEPKGRADLERTATPDFAS